MFDFPSFEELAHIGQILVWFEHGDTYRLLGSHRNQRPNEQDLKEASQRATDGDIGSIRAQCTRVVEYRTIRLDIENEVITRSASGEILLRVINDLVKAQ